MSCDFALHNNETLKGLTSLPILMQYHSGGDSVVLSIAPASPTSWDLGPRLHNYMLRCRRDVKLHERKTHFDSGWNWVWAIRYDAWHMQTWKPRVLSPFHGFQPTSNDYFRYFLPSSVFIFEPSPSGQCVSVSEHKFKRNTSCGTETSHKQSRQIQNLVCIDYSARKKKVWWNKDMNVYM